MFKIVNNERLSDNMFRVTFEAPLVARKAQPGQFLMFRVDEFGERMPITISSYDREAGTVSVIMQRVGSTTALLASKKAGDYVADVVGPLGNPAEFDDMHKVVVVGGGSGCAIAWPQAKEAHRLGCDVDIIAGFRTKGIVVLEEEMRACCDHLYMMTDDGTYGEKGFTTVKLKELLEKAKAEGKLVGWSSSKFPCELAEAFDLNVMYPENQAAGIAAQRDGEIMCQAAEDLGFDNDICGYARISLAYAAGKRASRKFDPETLEFIIDPNSGKPLKDENGKVVIDPETGKPKKDPKTQVPYTVLDDIHEIEALPETTEKEIAYKNFRREAIKPYKQMRIPQPDFVLCCNNICNCMTKWYENIARMCNIPLIMVDIPYNNTVEVSDSAVKYVRAQFDNAIHELEKLTGKKFDEKKFELACKHANRTAQNWLKVCDFLQYKPAPMSGFDLFNHMADVVTARGKEAAADAFELLSKDLQKNIEEGTSTLPFPEQYRVMFEGIPCWPKLPNLFKPLKENGINVTAVVYAPAFGFVYNNMDEMARAYYKAPNSVCIEQGVAWREGICRDNKVDGVLVHYNRSCKPWSGYMAEMQRRFTADLGVPCAGFDGDQADPRNFNEAQYATRVQGLVEAMEANKKD